MLLFGWSRLDQLLYEPLTTPEQWCERRPCITVGSTVFNEPLGSVLVFLLAFLWIAAGMHFFRSRRAQRSRAWFGIALVLGGIGAAQAGISYQAFSYALKCAGREHCLLTNGLEVGYSLTQGISVSAMLVAVAYACATDGLRRTLIAYAVINAVLYLAISTAGVMLPSRMLLSFEVLMLFALPGILLVIAITARGGQRSLLIAAVLLLMVQVAYFGYAAAGITARLWRDGQGFYFSENDVLHLGMIGWLGYIFAAVDRSLADHPRGP